MEKEQRRMSDTARVAMKMFLVVSITCGLELLSDTCVDAYYQKQTVEYQLITMFVVCQQYISGADDLISRL